jgi:hypothetical protein
MSKREEEAAQQQYIARASVRVDQLKRTLKKDEIVTGAELAEAKVDVARLPALGALEAYTPPVPGPEAALDSEVPGIVETAEGVPEGKQIGPADVPPARTRKG